MKKKENEIRNLVRMFKNPRTFILFVIVCALTCVSLFLFISRPSQIDRLGISYLELIDKKVVQKNIPSKFEEAYRADDFVIYGENLTFYHEKYTGKGDDMQGMNVILKNVETQDEISYTFSGGVDSGIQLGALKQGLYEVYVYDHYIKKRLYFKKPVDSLNFSTLRREGKVHNVTVHAGKEYLEDFDVPMDKNYAFISVVENIPMVKTIDVLIDPSGNVYNEQSNSVDYGVGNDLITEAKASYEFALKIKAELEKSGLRVELTRDADGTPSYYGQHGRAGIGYEKQAKVFLSLGMFVDENIMRPYMMISPFTTGLLANDISYNLGENGIQLPDVSAEEGLGYGILYDALKLDEEGNPTTLELYPQLRETGGKATRVGQGDFAKGNKAYRENYGMNAISFHYANLASIDSIHYFLDNQDLMAKTIAHGILDYYEIKEVEDETANQ